MMLRIASLLVIAALISGCGSSAATREQYITCYHEGRIERAEDCLNKTIKKRVPKGNVTRAPDSPWLLLDRATVRWVKGDSTGAIDDYRLALDALNYYDQPSDPEAVASIALGENVAAYQAPPFEQMMARCYFALTLLQEGDEQNAFALLRQAEEWQQQRSAELPDCDVELLVGNPLCKLLFATMAEKRGEKSNAEILVDQSLHLLRRHGLPPCGQAKGTPDMATVLVICHNGNAPFKVSETCPESLKTSLAVEAALIALDIDPAISSSVGFEIPVLQRRHNGFAQRTAATLGRETQVLSPCYDLDRIAHLQLQDELPVLVAKGIARQILRRGAVAAVQKADDDWGAAADLAMLIWNLNTHADTRSWTTLPKQVDIARFDVMPGAYPFTLSVDGPTEPRCCHLRLAAGSLCVINVFNIHPGYTVVQIPNTFLITMETDYEQEPTSPGPAVQHAIMRM